MAKQKPGIEIDMQLDHELMEPFDTKQFQPKSETLKLTVTIPTAEVMSVARYGHKRLGHKALLTAIDSSTLDWPKENESQVTFTFEMMGPSLP